jgi:hypothetical protein
LGAILNAKSRIDASRRTAAARAPRLFEYVDVNAQISQRLSTRGCAELVKGVRPKEAVL